MKIKSHTGNMVDVREMMVVELGKPIDGCSAKPAGTRHIVNSLCDAELFDYECTMLSCPFQVGDEVQINDLETGEFYDAGKIIEIDSDGFEIYDGYSMRTYIPNAPPNLIRHSNPDLRAKGEV